MNHFDSPYHKIELYSSFGRSSQSPNVRFSPDFLLPFPYTHILSISGRAEGGILRESIKDVVSPLVLDFQSFKFTII